jgi:hypothetical protein
MSKGLLETIATEIDYLIEKDEIVDSVSVLNNLDIPSSDKNRKSYVKFIEKYSDLIKEYKEEKQELLSQNEVSFDFGRIGWNTFYGGLLGLLFDQTAYIAPIGAALGCGLTVYDETKKRGMDLSSVAWGTIIGGFLGNIFDSPNSDLYAYVGAGAGASIGLIKEWVETKGLREKNDNERRKMIEVSETRYKSQRENLITKTLKSIEERSSQKDEDKENGEKKEPIII